MDFLPFRMERWQSTYEHRVRYNLSESGVHPLTVGELLELSGREPGESLADVRLGYGQSNGSDALRARIASLYPGATEANVLVTVGGAEANFVSAWHLMEPGQSAAVMVPNYGQVPGVLETFGVKPLPFHLREEEAWAPDLGELEAALDAGARFILVTNPNNPTGRALTPEAMDRIVALADAHGAWILADEVYRGAEAEGEETPSFWGKGERVLATHSLSKAYALPGLRVGWVVGPADVVARLWARTDYTTIAVATLSDRLALLALEPGTRERILERTRGIVRANRDLTVQWCREHGFAVHPPDAGAIAYLRYSQPVSSSALAETLRVEKDVLVVPGDHFGMDHYLRIGFGPPREELLEGLERVSDALEEAVAAR